MRRKIVTDSAANLRVLEGVDFEAVPLRIVTADKEYVDNTDLDVEEMVKALENYKGKSGSACPGVGDWLAAFDDAEEVYCLTIISTLSGSYNSAMIAKSQYEEEHPGRKVFVLDSYSAGPEIKLLAEKIRDYIVEGHAFDVVCNKIREYKEKCSCLVFALESLKNLANNGRCSHAVAAIAGLVGIRVVGDVSEDGQLNPTNKCRGAKKAYTTLVENMKKHGYKGGKVIIDHCLGEENAQAIKELLLSEFNQACVRIEKTTGLCSFYAERGGLLIGFERG